MHITVGLLLDPLRWMCLSVSSLLTSSGVLDEADCESGGGSEQGHDEDAEDVTEDVGVCTGVH